VTWAVTSKERGLSCGRTVLLATLIGVLSIGCVSFSSFKTARALRPGEVQALVAIETTVADTGNAQPSGGDGWRQPLGYIEGGARFGVARGLDLGFKLIVSSDLFLPRNLIDFVSSVGPLQLNSTVQLVKTTHFDLALAPAADFNVPWPVPIMAVHLPLLMGLTFGEGQLVLGPAFIQGIILGSTSGLSVGSGLARPLVGSTLGYSFKLGVTRVMPEVAIFYSPPSASDNSSAQWFYNFGIGFSPGGDGFGPDLHRDVGNTG
jgi:hypothetical protein